MMTSSLSHHVTIDSRFINLFMSVVILEGVGRQLDKDLNIISTALPVILYSIPEYGEVVMERLVHYRLPCRRFEKVNSPESRYMCRSMPKNRKHVIP